MDVVAVESTNGAKPLDFGFLVGENYEIVLKESIDRFLDQFRKGISDFSGFGLVFFRFLQARVDPPFEVIWFYSAVSFRSSNSPDLEPSNRVSMAQDLFQLLSACAASCSGLKSVALLAPVLLELYWSVIDLREKKLSLKSEKKIVREIERLMEGIIGYISVCCSKRLTEEDASVGLLLCISDLVDVWTVDRLGRNQEVEDDLNAFFPLIGDEIRQGLGEGGFVVGDLAGIVISQAFLLRLCLKFRSKLSRPELQKELTTLAVGSITVFRNLYFYDTLVRMLLEPTLSVTSLLGPEDEVLLRKALYDAVILVDYSFLNLERGTLLHSDCMKRLAVTMLVLTHEASQFVREHGDQTKAISYINAFSGSRLPSQLVKWITTQFGLEEKASTTNVSTPKALIKWLLNLEEQGVRVFDHNLSKLRTKLILKFSESDFELPVPKPDSRKQGDDHLFYIDNKGEEEDKNETDEEAIKTTDAALLAVARTMKLTANDGRRKRKKGRRVGEELQVKFIKYRLDDESVREEASVCSDDEGLQSGSEVENPLSDEDSKEMD